MPADPAHALVILVDQQINVAALLPCRGNKRARKYSNFYCASGTVEALGAASVELLRTVKSALLPRPGKEHYQFGVRDLVKMVEGLQLASKSFHDNQASALLWLANLQMYVTACISPNGHL